MIRNALAAIANVYESVWRPTPEPFPMRLSMVHPVLLPKAPSLVPPPVHPPKRFYRVRDGGDSMNLIGVAASDLLAYPHTRDALIRALAVHGKLSAHTVVIETRDWVGEFTIDANDNAGYLVLELVEGADVVRTPHLDERGSLPAWA